MAEEQYFWTGMIRMELTSEVYLPYVAITTKNVIGESRVVEELRSEFLDSVNAVPLAISSLEEVWPAVVILLFLRKIAAGSIILKILVLVREGTRL